MNRERDLGDHGRAVVVTESGLVDINRASGGRFSATSDDLIPVLDAVRAWYGKAWDSCVTYSPD